MNNYTTLKKLQIIRITLLVLLLTFVFNCTSEPKTIKVSGVVFGTTYSVIYLGQENHNQQFDSLFNVINQSMSTYIEDSDISKLNRNEDVEVDKHFKRVLKASKEVYRNSEGAFDPSIGNVVNAWNFGAEENKFLTDSTIIDSLMKFVGLNRIGLIGNKIKKPKEAYIEFNAIAKGYGVDVITEFLETKAVNNYLVEIGGEVRVKGENIEKNSPWRIGLDEPRFDGGQSVYKAIELKDEAMATSGTYRKFKIDKNGNRYAHIINTKTGYPTKTSILSVSVIAPDCTTADGYATAFQAMGIERVTWFLNSHPELKAYFIYEDEAKNLQTLNLNDFPE
ncbi:FAD:protein FMN transferase [Winogradskyella sp. PG-2]|uniref:FAD:protein FMN transferase n=1 Tax=Winogradskyella sp. PG-2 TaxID=754409 RepID=UPI0004587F3B|nr:FAD:protein FMN transferase [Winogradskyella sp. PG-2]BAO76254.1 thiamin biosynthesis lipoprotein ApbE [Winogradskyella sp. PG-2]